VLETYKKLPKKKQTAILNAAAHVFATKGYYRANVSDICRMARISNGALYKYFKNKEDVYVATLHRMIDLIAESQARYLPVAKPVCDLIYDLLTEVEIFARDYPNYIVIYLDLGSPSMKSFSERVSERMERPSRDFWVRIIEEGKQRGEVDKSLNSESAAYDLDNHVMLFMFSCVSPHYTRRFNSYFEKKGKNLASEAMKRLIIESIRRLLT
jgi:TetR/AcrR family transcriptional regulator